jgi:hypothetical protein
MATRVCKKGNSCGKSCISQSKVCRKNLSPKTQDPLEEKAKAKAKVKPPETKTMIKVKPLEPKPKPKAKAQSLDEFINLGDEFLKQFPDEKSDREIELEARLKKTRGMSKNRVLIEGEIYEIKKERQKKILEALAARSVKTNLPVNISNSLGEAKEIEREMANFGINRKYRSFSIKEKRIAEQHVADFANLFANNPLGDGEIRILIEDGSSRAYAAGFTKPPVVVLEDPKAPYGKEPNKRVIFHELGHHIEYGNPNVAKASNEFLQKRRDPNEPDPVNLPGYGKDEEYYKGDFFHPYVGRKYKNGSTEVISMGIQNFADPGDMLILEKKDPEMYRFILGVILNA